MGARIVSAEASVRACGGERSVEMRGGQGMFFGAPMPCIDWGNIGATDHFIQLYEEDAHLLDAVSRFTGIGLKTGEAAVVIATQPHRDHLGARLRAHGVDLRTMRAQGQYVS